MEPVGNYDGKAALRSCQCGVPSHDSIGLRDRLQEVDCLTGLEITRYLLNSLSVLSDVFLFFTDLSPL